MTVSLSDLLAQKEALERQIQAAQNAAKAGAIVQVRKLMAEHGLTAMDLTVKSATKGGTAGVKKVAAKYRDPISGSTWTGRGLKPKWLTLAIQSGKTLQDFAI